MFLSYNDLAELFPEKSGIKDPSIFYQSATVLASDLQPKGLFISAFEHSGELKHAIENGAVSALWRSGKEIPSYTPNHFPIFYTDDLINGIKRILESYLDKIRENEIEESTKLLFLQENLLIENEQTYDIAVMLKKIEEMIDIKIRKEGMK